MSLAMPASADTTGSASPAHAALACLVIAARQRGVHLTIDQLIRDNVLTGEALDTAQLMACARRAGLAAAPLQMGWSRLVGLGKALPAIIQLNNGAHVVLRRVEGHGDDARLVLQESGADDHQVFAVDRIRFEAAWDGDVILIKRNYAIADETQPFSIRLVAAMMFRERWVVRDIVICALVLSVLALAPIVFWRLLSDRVIYFKAYNTLYVLCIAMAVAVVFEAILSYVRQYLVVHLTTRIDIGLSTYLFDKLLNLPIDFFERTQVGRVTHDAQQLWKIRSFLTGQLFGTVLDSATMMVFLPVMFFFSPIMTFVVLASCALIAAWIVVMLPYCRRKASAVETAEAARGAFLVQTIHGIRTVKSLALDARQRHIWDIHTAQVAKLRMAEGQAGNLLFAVVKPLERFAVSGSFGIGVYLALSSSDPVYIGALFAFLLLSQRVTGPLLQMARLINQYDEARIAVSVVSALVNQPAEEGRNAQGIRTPVEGHVQFSGVTFRYQGASSPALRDVTFEVPMGTTLGVMGRSGSGKTTITRLLQRLHSSYDGLIKVDGIDVREYDVDHLRRSLGVVLQDNYLFSGSIRENIQAAKPEATFEEVVRAARLAGAEEFIDKLPRGYDTHIFEGSSNLSGGQRQRLAIARALIIDPKVLILDEATSALDADSEAIVNANISRIAQGRTLIIISHRLSSLVGADAILVLDRGEIADVGRHEELLDRCQIYSSLWDQQTQHVHRAPPPRVPGPQRGLVRVA